MSDGELYSKNLKFTVKDKDGEDMELSEQGREISVNTKNREEYLNAIAKYEIITKN